MVGKNTSKNFSKSRGIVRKFHLKKNFQVQGHSEMNGIRKFSKSRGTVKKVL